MDRSFVPIFTPTNSCDSKFIISGSEDQSVYIWNAVPESMDSKTPARTTVLSSEEVSNNQDVHGGNTDGNTSNNPSGDSTQKSLDPVKSFSTSMFGFKLSRRDRNTSFEAFQAHSTTVTCACFAPLNTSTLLERSGLRCPSSSSSEDVSGGQASLSQSSNAGDGRPRSNTIDPSTSLNSNNGGSESGNALSPKTVAELKRTLSSASRSDMASVRTSRSAMQGPLLQSNGRIIVTADYTGCIRVFENEQVVRGYYLANLSNRGQNNGGGANISRQSSVRSSAKSNRSSVHMSADRLTSSESVHITTDGAMAGSDGSISVSMGASMVPNSNNNNNGGVGGVASTRPKTPTSMS